MTFFKNDFTSVHSSIDQLDRPTAFQRTMEFKTYFETKLVAIGPCFSLSPVENEVEQSNCYGRDSKGLHSKSYRFMYFNLKKKDLSSKSNVHTIIFYIGDYISPHFLRFWLVYFDHVTWQCSSAEAPPALLRKMGTTQWVFAFGWFILFCYENISYFDFHTLHVDLIRA